MGRSRHNTISNTSTPMAPTLPFFIPSIDLSDDDDADVINITDSDGGDTVVYLSSGEEDNGSSGGDDGAYFPNGASNTKPVSMAVAAGDSSGSSSVKTTSNTKPVSTATSFVVGSSNDGGDSSGPSNVKAASNIADTSFVAASSYYGGDSDSDSDDTTPTRHYNYWHRDDNIHLVEADGRLLRKYGPAHVPPSALLEEFLNGRTPFRRGELTSRIIGDKRRYLRNKFLDMCKNRCKRSYRKPRTQQENELFKCCMKEWPHIMEQARAELEDEQ